MSIKFEGFTEIHGRLYAEQRPANYLDVYQLLYDVDWKTGLQITCRAKC